MLEKSPQRPHILVIVVTDVSRKLKADYQKSVLCRETVAIEDVCTMPDSCPIWDLTDLYSGITDVKLASDVAACRKAASALQDRWQGKLTEASADDLATVIGA